MKANSLSAYSWGRFCNLVHVHDYHAGQGLYEQGDAFSGLYRIESGLVGLRKVDENGSTMLVGLLGPGDFVGYAAFLHQGEHLTSAEVLQPSRISFVCAKTVRSLVRETPDLLEALFAQATRDLARLEDRCLEMGTQQAHTRLARLLLALRNYVCGNASNRASSFQLPILNKDMADLIGIRPETLSRAIAQLRSSGVAELRGRMVHVPSPLGLARMAGTDMLDARLAA
jgi:CRP/FNR family transcriptional regulator